MGNEKVTYKLIDKEGFMGYYEDNCDIVALMEGDYISGFMSYGELITPDHYPCDINELELHNFFELVPDKPKSMIWNGDIKTLEVGSIVQLKGFTGTNYTVKYYCEDDDTLLLKSCIDGRNHLHKVEDLYVDTRSHKEVLFDKALEEYCKKNKCDAVVSGFKSFFDEVYVIIKEEGFE